MAETPYGHQDEHLSLIINKTNDALDQMQRLHGQVLSHSQELPTVNTSDSGRILSSKLDIWTENHNRVVNNLLQLNQKATALRNTNNSTNQNAGDLAR